MWKSIKHGETVFHHKDDYSGDVFIVDTNSYEEARVPMDDLLKFMDAYQKRRELLGKEE